MIGVSVATLQNWEQGRRRPEERHAGVAEMIFSFSDISQALANLRAQSGWGERFLEKRRLLKNVRLRLQQAAIH